MNLAQKVETLRGRGASVAYNAKEATAAVNLAPLTSTNFYKLEVVEDILMELNLKTALGDISKAEVLLISLLQDAHIL
jgi:hypothetical protein